MSVFLIIELECTLAASHAAPWWVTVMSTEETDRRTDVTSLHYAFYYGGGQRNKIVKIVIQREKVVKNSNLLLKD